jgi:O-antigen/teichoic acid export membrane protein
MWSITDKPANKKQIYFWNMAGSLISSLTSVILLMIVSHFFSNSESDIFSIAFSVSQMLYTVGSFQVRVFQSTDVKQQFSYHEYRAFRIITCIIMILSALGYSAFHEYGKGKALILLILTAYRMIDAYADVVEGLYQQKERLDLAGRFLSLRAGSAIIIFAIIVFATHNLIAGCLSMCVVAFCILILFSGRHTWQFIIDEQKDKSANKLLRKIWHIFIQSLPIFLNGFLLNYIFNIPKNAIDVGISSGILQGGSQTIYNILFMPAFVVNLMFIFFRPQITRMAVYYTEGNIRKMLIIAFKIGLILISATSMMCLLGVTIGIPVLGFLYGKNLSNYRVAFAVILVGGGISTLATLLDNLLTIIRYQYFNIIAYTISSLFTLGITSYMIKAEGILGAALAFLFSMLVLLLVLILLFCGILSNQKRRAKSHNEI